MSAIELTLIFGSLASVAAFWSAPGGAGQNAVAGITAMCLALVAPLAAVWLLGSVIAVPLLMGFGDRLRQRGAVVLFWTVVLATLLLLSREVYILRSEPVVLVGGAYFTLRHVHVLLEWWMGRMAVPSIGAYARYHLFLPVLMVGPIHRMPHFERQCARRRWQAREFYSGAERALFGLALAVIVGEYLFFRLEHALLPQLDQLGPFAADWIISALDWIRLYVQFSGFTGLALGLSLMMGLKLEENFDRPWRARNLVEFWSRWHMTLSHWCRDYVYAPIAARFRAPVAGVFAAMLVLGLWHETSLYYVLWAVWQALGIILTQVYLTAGDPLGLGRLPHGVQVVLAPITILAWLSAARPILESFLLWAGLS